MFSRGRKALSYKNVIKAVLIKRPSPFLAGGGQFGVIAANRDFSFVD
jgi:hypothetical protein